MESRAYRAGVRAGKEGNLRMSNPHHMDKKEYEEWDAGWVAGTQEYRQKLWGPNHKAFRSQAKIASDKLSMGRVV